MKEIINKIKDKIKNNKLEFTKMELEYLKLIPELKKEIVNILEQNNLEWTESFYFFIKKNWIYFYIKDDDINDNIIYNLINGSTIYDKDYSIIEYINFQHQISDIKRFKPLKEKIYNNLENYNNKNFSVSALIKLLDEKEYALIKKINSKITISVYNDEEKKLLDRMLDEYPFEKYGYPHILDNYITHYYKQIKYMDLHSIAHLIKNLVLDNNKIIYNKSFLKEINSIVVSNIYDLNFLKEFKSEDEELLKVLNDTQIKEFNAFLLDNKLYYLCSKFSKDIIEDIVNNIGSDENTYNSVRYLFLNSKCGNLENYDIILDTFLGKNDILPVLNIGKGKFSNTERKEKYINKIIKNIKRPEIAKQINENIDVLYDNTKLYIGALDAGILTKLPVWDKMFVENKSLEEKLRQNLLRENTKMIFKDTFIIGKHKLFDIAFETKKYDLIFSVGLYPLMDNYENEIINALETSEEFIIKFFNHPIELRYLNNNQKNRIVDVLTEKNDISTYFILDYICNRLHFDNLINEHLYKKIKPFIKDYYGYDLEKLDLIVEAYGYKIIKYLDNENIKEVLSLSKEEIKRLNSLLFVDEYTLADAESLFDSVKQYELTVNYPEVVDVASLILEALDSNDVSYRKYLHEVSNFLDQKFINYLEKEYLIPEEFKNDYMRLLNFVVNKVKINKNNPEKYEKYEELLRMICDYYIAKQRIEFRKFNNMYDEVKIPYEIEQKSLNNFLIDLVIQKNTPGFILDSLYSMKTNIDKSLIIDVLNYLKNPNTNLYHDKKTVQDNIKNVKKLIQERINHFGFEVTNNSDVQIEINKAINSKKIKVIHYIPTTNKEDIIMQLLTDLRLDIVKEKVLNDDKVYLSLKSIMEKVKPHYIPSFLVKYINNNKTDLEFNSNSITALINYYYEIYEEIKNADEVQPTIPTLLKNIKAYTSLPKEYSLLLTPDDAKAIAANNPPISAHKKTKNNQRLKESISYTIDCFKRMEVTVPSFNQIIKVNGKKIRCVVGNYTHPSNLSHGERTGSCMRIGGIGESLYDFALKNINGFHIRFEDPITGEYISRATGFRNGNSLVINGLRYSKSGYYTNEDLVEAIHIVSNLIIEKSKDSLCPIDNVIIHKDYAMENASDKRVYLGVESLKEGFNNLYTDLISSEIVLASSNKDNSLVPINFDKSNIPIYKPAREKVLTNENKRFIDIINRVHAVHTYLETNSIIDIEPLAIDEDIIYGMANMDWYVYVDEKFKVHSELIVIDERAKIEMNAALNYIKKHILNKTKGENDVKTRQSI